jgi:hypothetical protein
VKLAAASILVLAGNVARMPPVAHQGDMFTDLMNVYRGCVRNGRLLVDEPTDLPEGSIVDLVLPDPGDDLDDEERARLHAALERSEDDLKHGRVVPAADVLRRLRDR